MAATTQRGDNATEGKQGTRGPQGGLQGGHGAGRGSEPERHAEGPVARRIEEYTARLPSDTFLWAAGASVVGSLALMATGNRHGSLFVGQWAPTLLILGLYNKIVKVAGSDRAHAS